MDPLHRQRQAYIVVHHLAQVEVRIAFWKDNDLTVAFSFRPACSGFRPGGRRSELDAELETGIDRQLQVLETSVT